MAYRYPCIFYRLLVLTSSGYYEAVKRSPACGQVTASWREIKKPVQHFVY